jgi:hypothetical protein
MLVDCRIDKLIRHYNRGMKTYQHSTVTAAIDVSFAVDKMDYGTLKVPVGTAVERFKDADHSWSDWFVTNPQSLPDNGRIYINGRLSAFYMHDAKYRGVRIPNANVKQIKETV